MTMTAVDLVEKLRLIDALWTPKIVAQVNDTQVKLAKIQGTFDWHSHARRMSCSWCSKAG